MAVLHPRLDSWPRPAAPSTRLRAFASDIGPLFGRSYDFYLGRLRVHHDVGDVGRQSVLRRGSSPTARHPVASMDCTRHTDAVVVHDDFVCHGKHWYRKYTHTPFRTILYRPFRIYRLTTGGLYTTVDSKNVDKVGAHANSIDAISNSS